MVNLLSIPVNKPCRLSLLWQRGLCLFLVLLLWALPTTASAHPSDEYLQAAYVTVAPDQVTVELELTPGPLVAAQLIALLDQDQDGQLSAVEGERYGESVLQAWLLQVDGQPHALTLQSFQLPELLLLQAGAAPIRLTLQASWPIPAAGAHQLSLQTAHRPVKSVYQLNTLLPKAESLTITGQSRSSTYQRITIDYTVAATSARPTSQELPGAVPTASMATPVSGQAQLLSYLAAPTLSPWVLTGALALAVLLGGVHALTPGHGKTLVAAYLVGSRGTVQHALFLGGIVTFTHTASVIGFGILALVAGQWLLSSTLLPLLEMGSGLFVVVLGGRLLWLRWALASGPSHHAHSHSHPHAHDHPHDHDGHHQHNHALPDKLTVAGLLTMGVSGGLVPCPEALGILLVAIGLNRIGLGLGLIIAFSLGLAAVLMGLGLLLVRSRPLLERLSGAGARWQLFLPRVSALIVTLLGAGIMIKGITAFLAAL